MSFPSRAPKGIPSGGQFVASARSEPSISLGKPNARQSMPLASAFVEGWDRKEATPADGLTHQNYADAINEARASADGNFQWAEPEYSPGIRGVAEKVSDGIGEAYDTLGDVASRVIDVQSGDAPVPEVEGSFVGWGQMVPKFLRREKPAKVTEPEP